MRLKTLRKERPAFENEGAVINGNRMDLTNNETKPSRYRSNNAFVLPTSLTRDLSSMRLSSSEMSGDFETIHPHQASTHEIIDENNHSEPAINHLSTYQEIEAVYLEHGIRIHLNSTSSTQRNQQQTPRINSQRPRVFINRNPSRSSSALQYPNPGADPHQDCRPFSALQQDKLTVTNEAELSQKRTKVNSLDVPFSHLPTDYSSASILESERSAPITPNEQQSISKSNRITIPDDDPDLLYMSKLLKTANGDSFRDSIRRRAGLRGTFAVHRHPTNGKNSSTDKRSENPSVSGKRSSILRQSVLSTALSPAPATKKVEKDIIKHASRIRTSHSKEMFVRQTSPERSRKINQSSSVSTSPNRTFKGETKRTKIKRSSRAISLEPLELLLGPEPNRSSTSMNLLSSSSRYSTADNDDIPKKSRSFLQRSNDSFERSSTLRLNQSLDPSMLTIVSDESSNESLPSLRASIIDVTITRKPRQADPIDPILCDRTNRSDASDEFVSGRSSSIREAPGSALSSRLNSSSTCRSKSSKRVSFHHSSTTYLITAATYI